VRRSSSGYASRLRSRVSLLRLTRFKIYRWSPPGSLGAQSGGGFPNGCVARGSAFTPVASHRSASHPSAVLLHVPAHSARHCAPALRGGAGVAPPRRSRHARQVPRPPKRPHPHHRRCRLGCGGLGLGTIRCMAWPPEPVCLHLFTVAVASPF